MTRTQIKAAMNAFDRYRENGQGENIFGAFGEPRDYWVGSTRDRNGFAYPTKPIVGFISQATRFNGGWGQNLDAASRLHTAGYVIVDQKDHPHQHPPYLKGGPFDPRDLFLAPSREDGKSHNLMHGHAIAPLRCINEISPQAIEFIECEPSAVARRFRDQTYAIASSHCIFHDILGQVHPPCQPPHGKESP